MSTTADIKKDAPPPKSEDEKKVLKPGQSLRLEDDVDDEDLEEETQIRPISGAMTWRLMSWLKPYWRLYLLGGIAGVIALVLDLLTPLAVEQIVETAKASRDFQPIMHFALIWLGLAAGNILFDVVQIWATNRCGERVIFDMRIAVFGQLQRLSMSFYDRTKLGKIITRGTSDMEALRGPVISGINTVAFNFLLMLGSALMILFYDWHLFLAVAWLSPILAFANSYYRKIVGVQHQITRQGYSRVAANLAENITGVRVVSAFNRQDANLERFNELQEINTSNNVRVAHINGIYGPFLEFIKFVGQVIIFGYGGVLAISGKLNVGGVVAIYMYWDKFMGPTINMGTFYNQLMGAMASAERLFALLDMKPEVQDRPNAKPLPRLSGHIIFENVTFGYDPTRPVLHGINLEIPAGKTYALVGHTGSGKSSTVSLLARFYELQQGSIRVDGIDIREATTESLHKQMGLVLQVNYLFSGTVLDNIRYPRPEATDDEVFAAAKALDLHETFLALPNGYNTVVGERGSSISLGLRQLICFARILLANPSIFLLDEATSSIDTVTEMKVQTALEKLVKGRTTVIVAHRLSTIVKADCIVVLDQGKIIEQGTHAELIALRGHYALMYERFVAHQMPVLKPESGAEGPVLK